MAAASGAAAWNAWGRPGAGVCTRVEAARELGVHDGDGAGERGAGEGRPASSALVVATYLINHSCIHATPILG